MKNLLIENFVRFLSENDDKDVARAEDEDKKVQSKRKRSGKSDQREQESGNEKVANFSPLAIKRAIEKAVLKKEKENGGKAQTPEPPIQRRKEVTAGESRMMGGTDVTKGTSKPAEDPGNKSTETVYNRYLHPTDKNAELNRHHAKLELLQLKNQHERGRDDPEIATDFRDMSSEEQEKIIKGDLKGYKGNPEKGATTVAVRKEPSESSKTGSIGTAIDIKNALEAKKAEQKEKARLRKQAQRAKIKAKASQQSESFYIENILDFISENLVVEAKSRLNKQWDGKKTPGSDEEENAQFNGEYQKDSIENSQSQAEKSEKARKAYLKRKHQR